MPYQVQFYHAKVGGCFDLDFCERDGAFVKDHLKAFVVGATFFKSMRRGVIVNHQPSAAKKGIEKATGSKKRTGGFKPDPEEISKKGQCNDSAAKQLVRTSAFIIHIPICN